MKALVLNKSWIPVSYMDYRKAVCKYYRALKGDLQHVRFLAFDTHNGTTVPVLIQVDFSFFRKQPKTYGSNKEIFIRDQYLCQYCGCECHKPTVDHVIPASRGGASTFANLVTCCYDCNQRKADRTPEEAGMQLRNQPRTPWLPIIDYYHSSWDSYMFR